MSYLIRKAVQKDVSQLGKLLDAYVRETYQGAWGGNVELLERHLIENAVEMLLAETPVVRRSPLSPGHTLMIFTGV